MGSSPGLPHTALVLAALAWAQWLPAQAPSSASALALQAPQADATLPLFTVMAAMTAASDESAPPFNSPPGRPLRQELAGKKIPCLEDLRSFQAAHRLSDPRKEYSRYVSFALVIEGPPDFAFRVRQAELPEDARALDGLNSLVAAFYSQAALETLWEKYRAAYDQEAVAYQDGIGRVMLEVNGYLRNSTSGYLGRTFSVYIDLLGPANQVNARSFGADYYVVVTPSSASALALQTPSAAPHLEEIRHGYLHYVLEPLAAKYSAEVRAREKLLEVAARAPALDPVLRSNFRMLLTESLIRAVELRMGRAREEEKQKRLEEVAGEGYFLAPYFFEAFQKFEQQDTGIRLYYPTLIEKLDVRREEKRAEKIAFRATPATHLLSETTPVPATSRLAPFAATAASDELERWLAEGEDAIARHDLAAARRAYQAVLDRTAPGGVAGNDAGPTEHWTDGRARALYGLALVATQEKQPDVAKNFFQQTLETAREPRLLAWSHIYLGRLFDMENNRDLAVRHYQQALEAGDPAASVRRAAEHGLEAPFRAP